MGTTVKPENICLNYFTASVSLYRAFNFAKSNQVWTFPIELTRDSKAINGRIVVSVLPINSLFNPYISLLAGVPVCLPAILDISIYLFVNAMTTVSAVVFLYGPHTSLASVAVLNMDDAGDIAPAAAMGMMIFYTNATMRIVHGILSRGVLKKTQAWRHR